MNLPPKYKKGNPSYSALLDADNFLLWNYLYPALVVYYERAQAGISDQIHAFYSISE